MQAEERDQEAATDAAAERAEREQFEQRCAASGHPDYLPFDPPCMTGRISHRQEFKCEIYALTLGYSRQELVEQRLLLTDIGTSLP